MTSPSRIRSPGRHGADELDDFRRGLGHLAQRPREHADLVAGLVHLNARAIELVLERGVVQTVERRVDASTPNPQASAAPAA